MVFLLDMVGIIVGICCVSIDFFVLGGLRKSKLCLLVVVIFNIFFVLGCFFILFRLSNDFWFGCCFG